MKTFLKKLLRPDFIFFICQASAGVLNYLYQIYVSKSVNTSEFAEFSIWWANFSVGAFGALWIQNLSVLSDSKKLHQAWIPWFIFAVSSLSLLFCLLFPITISFYISGWALAFLFGLIYGRLLREQSWYWLSFASLGSAAFKFILAPIWPLGYKFQAAAVLSPLLIVLLLAFHKAKRKSDKIPSSDPNALLSAFYLSILASVIPQLDIILGEALLPKPLFEAYCQLALVNRGLFFLSLILAQILLSHLVNTTAKNKNNPILYWIFFAVLSGLLILGLLLKSPFSDSYSLSLAFIHNFFLVALFMVSQKSAVNSQLMRLFAHCAYLAALYFCARSGLFSFQTLLATSLVLIGLLLKFGGAVFQKNSVKN